MIKDVFLARQPIFDAKQNVYAYEILSRSGNTNCFDGFDGDKASSNAIIDTFQTFGIENLTNRKPAFVNFTDNLISGEVATLFPNNLLVVEILETVVLNKAIIESCKLLKKKGYIIALDDFKYKKECEPLIELADIIKVDFIDSSIEEIIEIIKILKNKKKLLAEKVETRREFEIAKTLGFSLFQGFFFSKPETMMTSRLQPAKLNYLRLINKLYGKEIDFKEISEIVSSDISMAYSVLKLVNSAAFGFRRRIESIKDAVVILGEKEIKKWLTLVALNGLGNDKPDEIVRLSLIRAKFGEAIAYKTRYRDRTEDIFLAGLFSLIDVILDRPLEDVLGEIQIPNDIKDCLLNKGSELEEIYNIIFQYEKGNWENVKSCADLSKIDYREITNAYINTLIWYSSLMEGQ